MARRKGSKNKSGKISLTPTAKARAKSTARRRMKMVIPQEDTGKKMPLEAAERETVIQFDASRDYATVYTRQKRIITKCKALGYEVVEHDDISYTFHCPLYSISFRSPVKCHRKRKSNNMVDEVETNE